MENENMDLQQLAAYLHRDLREVSKLANRGYLPGKKVGCGRRSRRSRIRRWRSCATPYGARRVSPPCGGR